MIKLKYLAVATLLMAIPLVDFSQNQGECYNTVSFCPTHKKDGFTKNMQRDTDPGAESAILD